jgi:hypothetical protein
MLLLPHLYFHAYDPLQSRPILSIPLARFCGSSLKRKTLLYNHKAKAMKPAMPANTAPLLTIFITAPPFDDADAEAEEPDAVDDDPAVLDAAVAELDAVVVVAAAAVELTKPPETGFGVGLPTANLKFAQARRVRLCEWMTMLRLPKKEFRPGSVDI